MTQTSMSEKDQIAWLRRAAIPIRSLRSNDFADLKAFGKAIEDYSLVMMGELTHGDGSAFEAKTRLVKYLHQRQGFHAIVWESGLFDCEQMNRALKGNEPIQTVARQGVFGHWSRSPESLPLFEYARSTVLSKQPLTMAGFDIQDSGQASREKYPAFMAWLTKADALSKTLRSEITTLLKSVREAEQPATSPETLATAESRLRTTARPLLAACLRHEDRLKKAWGVSQAEWMKRCLISERDYAQMLSLFERSRQQSDGGAFIASYNLREKTNADNLLWLARRHFAGKKMAVWAHNDHIINAFPHTGEVSQRDARPNELDSTGRLLKRSMGNKVYTLGLIGYAGQWAWMGGAAQSYQTPPEGSLESLLHRLAIPHLFLDLRAARQKKGHWLNHPMPGVVNQQSFRVQPTIWTQAFDGVFYIDRMKPRSQL